ncbi:MAG: LPS export ABC transporter permease LptF [Gammaproteobacteria bacterium]
MIIFRYLGKEVYGTLLASTFILLVVLISNQFVHYLTQAASGVIPIRSVMQIMSIQIPLLSGILLPLGLYLGILMAYGRLYVDREMTVLWACGFGKGQLLQYTVMFSVLVAVVVALLMLWIQPTVESYKRHILLQAATASPLEKVFPGQFTELGDSKLTFYVENLSRDHQRLEHIFAAQPQKNPKSALPAWNIVVAEQGHQAVDPVSGDRFLVLKDGYRYTQTPGQLDFQVVKYQTYGIRIEPNVLPADKRVEAIPTSVLWPARHQSLEYAAEMQWRMSLPLMALILALIAVPLSKVDPRQGRFAQLLPALLLYTVYLNLLFVAKVWVTKGKIPASIGLWGVHGVMLIVALGLLLRFMGWKAVWKSDANFKKVH